MGFNRTVGPIPASDQPKNLQNKPYCPVLQLPWRTRAQQLAHYQAQVEGAHMSQLTFKNILASAQVAAPHPARFVAVGEAAFHQFAASFQQPLAVVA
jgi:hypothetical protein